MTNRGRPPGRGQGAPPARAGSSSGRLATAASGRLPTDRHVTVSSDPEQRAEQRRKQAIDRRTAVKGPGLRTKIMVVMACLTAIPMLVLGATLIWIADSFLFELIKHNGIELSKMTAQVGRLVASAGGDQTTIESRLRDHLDAARRWGSGGAQLQSVSLIDAVQFQGGTLLSGLGVGSPQDGRALVTATETRVSLPGRATNLPDEIQVEKLIKPVDGGRELPIYRFTVRLNDNAGGYSATTVRVDIRYDAVRTISRRLMLIVGVAVVLAMAAVLAVAHVLARQIVRPVELLLRDMRQVAKGDLDHRTKAHSKDEVGVLATEFDAMTHALKEAQVAVIEQEKREYELSIAKEVQQQLLPGQVPAITGFETGAFYKGAQAVSGDYFDFIPLGGSLWGFIVADVSGKGIPGSMVMAVTRTIIRLVAPKHGADAAGALKETNRLIAKQIKRGMFVTAFYAVLDADTGRVSLASAGHNPMLLTRPSTGAIEQIGPKGIAIGFNDGPLFDKTIEHAEAVLRPGDSFVLYTDGFPEAMNERNEEYGDDRFNATVAACGHLTVNQMIQNLVGEISRHRGKAAQSDDLTMLIVRRSPLT